MPEREAMIMRQGSSISHNVRTLVIDPQGRIYCQFNDDLWMPSQLANATFAQTFGGISPSWRTLRIPSEAWLVVPRHAYRLCGPATIIAISSDDLPQFGLIGKGP